MAKLKDIQVASAQGATSVPAPTAAGHLVTKAYLESQLSALSAAMHAAVTVADSDSVTLSLSGQQVTAEVRRKSSGLGAQTEGRIGSGSSGIYAVLGLDSGEAAPGLKVAELEAEVDGKASAGHTHAIEDTPGLQAALDGKAASSHTHAIGDTPGLQAALDGKAASSHSHSNATTSAAGFMSAEDKLKLDNISASEVYVLAPVNTFAELPTNTGPVGAVCLVKSEGRLYRCAATVGGASEQWRRIGMVVVTAAPSGEGDVSMFAEGGEPWEGNIYRAYGSAGRFYEWNFQEDRWNLFQGANAF